MDSAGTALIAGGVSLLVSGLSAWNAGRLQTARFRVDAERARREQESAWQAQEERLRADAENARMAQEAALKLQEERLRTELRTEFMAEEAIRALLNHKDWKKRSFREIQRRVRGFDEDALRQLFVRAGAVAFDHRERIRPGILGASRPQPGQRVAWGPLPSFATSRNDDQTRPAGRTSRATDSHEAARFQNDGVGGNASGRASPSHGGCSSLGASWMVGVKQI